MYGNIIPHLLSEDDHSEILEPPTELSKGGSKKYHPIEWNPSCTNIF